MHAALILIVEDEPATRRALSRIVERYGYRGIPKGSAEEAQETLRTCRCDLAILDIRLPGKPGDQFGQELSEACQVPIIFVSAEPSARFVEDAIPGSVFLQKPIDAERLLDQITALVAAHQNELPDEPRFDGDRLPPQSNA